jgi:3-oxoacyl-[acyl-carrier-protein] synthase III
MFTHNTEAEMKSTVKGIRIAGMTAAVPTHRHSYVEDHSLFTEEEGQKLFEGTGVFERRILPKNLCASDMCVAAAESLLVNLGWSGADVDVIIFVSQDADYPLPATACLIQNRLGMADTAAAFDVSMGCSGFIYGAWLATTLLAASDGKRALVLCGDNSTRHLVPDDRSTLPLFGDAGTATAFEKSENASDIHFVTGTDGKGAPHILVKAGGRRVSTIPDLEKRSTKEEAQLFNDARLHLNGAAVFSFTLKVVPKLVQDTLDQAGLAKDDIDHFVMHQANKFILEHLRKKAGIDPAKYLIDMHDFGNTSSASVPLAICHKLADELTHKSRKMFLSGFGVGWSWGGLITDMGPMVPPRLIEIPDDFPPLEL